VSPEFESDQPEVMQRIKETMACWEKAKETIRSFDAVTLYEVRTPQGIWHSAKEEVDANDLRALIGINRDIPIVVAEDDSRRRTMDEKEKLKLNPTKPLVIR